MATTYILDTLTRYLTHDNAHSDFSGGMPIIHGTRCSLWLKKCGLHQIAADFGSSYGQSRRRSLQAGGSVRAAAAPEHARALSQSPHLPWRPTSHAGAISARLVCRRPSRRVPASREVRAARGCCANAGEPGGTRRRSCRSTLLPSVLALSADATSTPAPPAACGSAGPHPTSRRRIRSSPGGFSSGAMWWGRRAAIRRVLQMGTQPTATAVPLHRRVASWRAPAPAIEHWLFRRAARAPSSGGGASSTPAPPAACGSAGPRPT